VVVVVDWIMFHTSRLQCQDSARLDANSTCNDVNLIHKFVNMIYKFVNHIHKFVSQVLASIGK
jgi:hypothetical protein